MVRESRTPLSGTDDDSDRFSVAQVEGAIEWLDLETPKTGSTVMLRTATEKLIVSDVDSYQELVLYQLDSDLHETRNLAGKHVERAQSLRKMLHDRLKASKESALPVDGIQDEMTKPDAFQIERLRALGYTE